MTIVFTVIYSVWLIGTDISREGPFSFCQPIFVELLTTGWAEISSPDICFCHRKAKNIFLYMFFFTMSHVCIAHTYFLYCCTYVQSVVFYHSCQDFIFHSLQIVLVSKTVTKNRLVHFTDYQQLCPVCLINRIASVHHGVDRLF